MNTKPEEVKTASPDTATPSGSEDPATSAQSTVKPADVSTKDSGKPASLNMSDIVIGAQPAPAGGIGDELTNEPPVSVSGIDAEKKRVRGRPPLNEEAKRAKQTAEKSGARIAGSKTAAPLDAQPAARVISPDSKSGAALIMQSLDFVRTVISDGEVDKGLSADEAAKRVIVREGTEEAWANYLEDCGAKLPPWAVVLVMSGVYVAPALRTPTAREKLGFAWLRIREWAKAKWEK